jgi:hypothetical protein
VLRSVAEESAWMRRTPLVAVTVEISRRRGSFTKDGGVHNTDS